MASCLPEVSAIFLKKSWRKVAVLEGAALYFDGCGRGRSSRPHSLHAQALGRVARRYVAALESGMAHLVEHQGAYQDMSAIYPGLCMAHCEHHYVFCLSRQSAPALIVAIFHERMDLMTRIFGRLKAASFEASS